MGDEMRKQEQKFKNCLPIPEGLGILNKPDIAVSDSDSNHQFFFVFLSSIYDVEVGGEAEEIVQITYITGLQRCRRSSSVS